MHWTRHSETKEHCPPQFPCAIQCKRGLRELFWMLLSQCTRVNDCLATSTLCTRNSQLTLMDRNAWQGLETSCDSCPLVSCLPSKYTPMFFSGNLSMYPSLSRLSICRAYLACMTSWDVKFYHFLAMSSYSGHHIYSTRHQTSAKRTSNTTCAPPMWKQCIVSRSYEIG